MSMSSGTKVQPKRASQPSSVSQALKALQGDLKGSSEKWHFKDGRGTRFRIFETQDHEARGRAQKLVHRMYVQRKYASGPSPELDQTLVPYAPRTFTLLAEDLSGNEAGTVSLVFDGPAGLPSDEIYRPELDQLRAKGRRLVEVVRLAIHDRHAKSKGLLVQLFNFISIYARCVRNDTDFVVSVNPRHSAFYRRLLDFKQAGPQRPCPRVQFAPAVLLSLDLAIAQPNHRNRLEHRLNRTLYPYFSSSEEENEIASCFGNAALAGGGAEGEQGVRQRIK